ncbi:hypothetical protein F4703DRAFT_1855217 [Phycomyces blakesleeanus]
MPDTTFEPNTSIQVAPTVSTSKTISLLEAKAVSKLNLAPEASLTPTITSVEVKSLVKKHSEKSPAAKPVIEKEIPKEQARSKQKEPVKSVSQKTRTPRSGPSKKTVETSIKTEKPSNNILKQAERITKKSMVAHENAFAKIQQEEIPRSVKEQTPIQNKPTPSSTVSEKTVQRHAKISVCAPMPSASKTINIARPSAPRAWNTTKKTLTQPVSSAFQNEDTKPPSGVFHDWCQKSLKELKKDVDADELLKMLLSFPLVPSPFEIIKEIIYANSTSMDGRRFAETFIKYRKADMDGQLKNTVVQPVNRTAQNSFKVVTKKSKRKNV